LGHTGGRQARRHRSPAPSDPLRTLAVALLVAVGLANAIAYLLDVQPLATAAKATTASPLPRAFSQSQSLAGFAKEFVIELTNADGRVERRETSSELFVGLPGPYERQVLYGAALTYTPEFPQARFVAMLRYGFCRGGPLAVRIGVHEPVRRVTVIGQVPRVASRMTPNRGARRLTIECASDASAR
jgi:hypothetical protein